MHPVLHPLYGFIERSNGMSGESLVLMTERACSGSSVVGILSGGSSRYHPSPTSSSLCTAKRPGGFESAPLPLNTCLPVIERLMLHTVRLYSIRVKTV